MTTALYPPNANPVLMGQRQRGIALMMALIAVVAMSLTAMALIRSVDTGNLIAGNVAFRQASVQTVDIGIEAAYNYIQNLSVASLEANAPTGCTTGCQYYAAQRSVDSTYDIVTSTIAYPPPGSPVAITWSSVPVAATINGVYEVKYVVDRLCTVAPVSDKTADCNETKLDESCSQQNLNNPNLCNIPRAVHFRATIRVTGPRNTTSFAQNTFTRYY